MAKFELFKATNGQFYWNLKASNGERVCQSEGYREKQGAFTGIQSCKNNAATLQNFELFQGKNGQHYWHLKARNGEIVAQSEGYVSKQGANDGAVACHRIAPTAPINDLT